MRFHLLRCLARAIVRNGLKLACNVVPGVGAVYEVAADAWEDYRRDKQEETLRAEVQGLAQAPIEQVRQDVQQAVEAEAAGQPAEVRQALVAYLTQVPAAIRRSLRRPSDPTGTTVPPSLALSQPKDLVTMLPPRPPRFKPGDRPLPGVDWELEELVGFGGFGEVWKARHALLRSKAPVALKFCLDESAVVALRNEAGVLDRVMQHGRHPGIVPLLQTYLSANPPCLEYELVEGGDLSSLIQELHGRKRLTIELANRLFLHLVEIVSHAHRANPPIVHGDLKPANVLVRRRADGKVSLGVTDFGIGGLAAARAVQETRQPTRSRPELVTEAVRGAYTPLYASPEQMNRQKGELADPRDDVHALGVIWYQLLTADLGMMSMPTDWRDQVEERGLDAELIRLLGACMSSKAEKRPDSALVVAERLRTALSGKPKVAEVASPQPETKAREPEVVEPPPLPAPQIDLATQMATALRNVEQAHLEARRLAREQYDYAAAVLVLEKVPGHLRDSPLFDELREKRDRVAHLDEEVRKAVSDTQVAGLRPKVAALLELQPQREDLCRLLENLPKEHQVDDIVPVSQDSFTNAGVIEQHQERQPGDIVEVSVLGDIVMKFAWCPPGTFLMGSPEQEKGRDKKDEVQHQVTLTRGFWMGVTPVTQAQWIAILGRNPSMFEGQDRPVEQVSWDDCQVFCAKLGERTGKKFRLPTEAEWEYACRAGSTTAYCNGNELSSLRKVGWCSYSGDWGSAAKTKPVGRFKPNAWGLYDMHGNVWEWCSDWYGPYREDCPLDPQGCDNGKGHVVRGGSWRFRPFRCRSAARCHYKHGAPRREGDVGFRLVLCLE